MTNEEKFKGCQLPDATLDQGEYAVKLVVPLLPNIRFLDHKKHVPASVENGGGCNIFLDRFNLGNFRTETGLSSLGDGLEVLKIKYDDNSNPLPLQLLTDELREESNGKYFCRGIYNLFGMNFIAMYFTMERL